MPTGHADRLLPALRRAVLVRETADRPDGDLLTAFVHDRDADAFAVLVRRHGPMVLGVCRRVVGDSHAADDAFQAVFLVLARRASAVRPRGQVGNWLYGVAYRTAIKARAVLARRRSREKQVEAMPEPPAPPTTDPWADLHRVIDEELARLPDRLRLPVVLCDLEGRPQRAVAKHLGVAPATLAARLASARRLLAGRLTRRGVTLSGGALATVLGERASAAVVAPRLADGVVRAAEAVATGTGFSGLVSAHAVQLCEGVMRMMLLSKLKAVGACTLAALVLTGGLGVGLAPAYGADDSKPTAQPPGNVGSPTQPAGARPITDAEFLRRLCLDLTGALPTPVEMAYFTADADAGKRAKVVEWLVADDAVKAFLAKKLGVAADRIRTVRLVRPGDPAGLAGVINLAFSPDGQRLAVATDLTDLIDVNVNVAGNIQIQEVQTGSVLLGVAVNSEAGVAGSVVLNERTFDVVQSGRLRPRYYRVKQNAVANATEDGVLNTWHLGWVKPNTADADAPVTLWALIANPPAAATSDVARLRYWAADGTLVADQPYKLAVTNFVDAEIVTLWDSDEAFLRRAVESARGAPPSAVELKYFAEDKDPKKRERVLDLLLKDPAVAKKVGDDWKKKMLAPPATTATWSTDVRRHTFQVNPRLEVVPYTARVRVWDVTKEPDRFEKLVGELIGARKTDEQVLEGVTLAAVGRLPTPEEKRATLAVVGTAADKKAAWVGVAKALAASDEGKKHAAPQKK